jgi:DNA-binding NarL/FixJ family response regulator
MAAKITVLLVDDHSLVRKGFRRMLEDDPEIKVLGEASSGEEAIRLAAQHRPQVITMDMAMPGMDGVEAMRAILKEHPETAVLILSMYSQQNYVRNALDAGARGYILKNANDLDLAAAVKAAATGKVVIDSSLEAAQKQQSASADGLTQRETQILQMIAEGKSNKEIAALLGLSVNTVGVHRANLMDALGMHRTAELVLYAVRKGLVKVP